MIPFDAAHNAVHYQPDRRFRIWISPAVTVILVLIVFIPLILAWEQNALFGLPHIPVMSEFNEGMPSGSHGFPAWIRWSHFFNMLFLFTLIRSDFPFSWIIHGFEAAGDLDSRMEIFEDWKIPFREGVVYYLDRGRVRGVLVWNTWEQVDHVRSVIAENGPFRSSDLKRPLPAS